MFVLIFCVKIYKNISQYFDIWMFLLCRICIVPKNPDSVELHCFFSSYYRESIVLIFLLLLLKKKSNQQLT